MGKGQIGRPGTANPITHTISLDSRGLASAQARPPTSYAVSAGFSASRTSFGGGKPLPGFSDCGTREAATSVSDRRPPSSSSLRDSVGSAAAGRLISVQPSSQPSAHSLESGVQKASLIIVNCPEAEREAEGSEDHPSAPIFTPPILETSPSGIQLASMEQPTGSSGAAVVASNGTRPGLGLPPRPKPVAKESASRPETAMSTYSTQALALGRAAGRVAAGCRNGERPGMRGGAGSSLAHEDDDDVDSVDVAMLRIRRNNNLCDEFGSIDIVNDSIDDGWDENGPENVTCLLTSDVQKPSKRSQAASMLKTGLHHGNEKKASQRKSSRFAVSQYVPQKNSNEAQQHSGRSKLLRVPRDDIRGGHAEASSSLSSDAASGAFATGGPPASWSRLIRQAAPMVLNLEDLTGSTPEVLEMELG